MGIEKCAAWLASTGAARAGRGAIRALILAWLTTSLAHPATDPPGESADNATLIAATDLRAVANEATQRGEPLLVLFSRPGCPYCDEVRKSWLIPLGKDRKYSGLKIRQIDQDSDRPLIDFAGKPTTHARFAAAQKVSLVPVVAVFGPRGEPLAEAIVGLRLRDFYGAYLEAQIDEARSRLRRQ